MPKPQGLLEKIRKEREVRFCNLKVRNEASPEEENKDLLVEWPELEGRDLSGYYIVEGNPVLLETETVLFQYEGRDVKEVIHADAFDDADLSDIVFNINHGDGNHGVAKVRTKTLFFHVKKDEKVCKCLVLLDKENPRCAQAYIDVSTGLLDKMSFAFTIREESFDEKEFMFHVRQVEKVYDVSAVDHPAYEGTSISARREESVVTELNNQAVAEETVKRNKKAALKLLIDLSK